MNWEQACELPYYHGSDLGANPTAEETTFKLWAPTACGVVVCLYATGTAAEPGAKELGVHEMRRGDGGVWAIALPGNLHGTYYIYRIYFPDGRVHEVVDPYARSAGANGTRGKVVDLTKAAPAGWEQDPQQGKKPNQNHPQQQKTGPSPRHPGPRPQRVGGACGGLFR